MTLPKLAGAVAANVTKLQVRTPNSTFAQTFQRQLGANGGATGSVPTPTPITTVAKASQTSVSVESKFKVVQPSASQKAVAWVDRLNSAQIRMDKVLEMAQQGKTFTPAQLLSLQAQVYRSSQELDLAGKVVEKATGGVKQILQTQI